MVGIKIHFIMVKEKQSMLEKFLNVTVSQVIINDSKIDFGNHIKETGEKITLVSDKHTSLEITTEDLPHFLGEADLDFNISDCSSSPIKEVNENRVKKIKIWTWKPKGISILAKKYLVQIEFFQASNDVLSIGFFHESTNGKLEFLSTGEIIIHNTALHQNQFDKNLSYIELT